MRIITDCYRPLLFHGAINSCVCASRIIQCTFTYVNGPLRPFEECPSVLHPTYFRTLLFFAKLFSFFKLHKIAKSKCEKYLDYFLYERFINLWSKLTSVYLYPIWNFYLLILFCTGFWRPRLVCDNKKERLKNCLLI